MDLKIRMFSWARLGGPLKAEGGGREIGSTGDLEVRGATEQKRGPRSDKCQDPEAASVVVVGAAPSPASPGTRSPRHLDFCT